MELIALGDTHIPDRAKSLNPALLSYFQESPPDAFLFTGDATEYGVLFLLEQIAPVYAVRGNMDLVDLPWELWLDFEKRIFLTHGHKFGRGNYSALTEYAKSADLLVCGHTHTQEHFSMNDLLVVNPGSATSSRTGEATFTKIIINRQVRVQEYRVSDNGIQSKRSESKNKI